MAAGCTTFDLMGGGGFKRNFGAVRDYSPYRWIRCRYRWLAHARRWAEKGYRLQQATRGIVARRWMSIRNHAETL
jgi:hypothetical protein